MFYTNTKYLLASFRRRIAACLQKCPALSSRVPSSHRFLTSCRTLFLTKKGFFFIAFSCLDKLFLEAFLNLCMKKKLENLRFEAFLLAGACLEVVTVMQRCFPVLPEWYAVFDISHESRYVH